MHFHLFDRLLFALWIIIFYPVNGQHTITIENAEQVLLLDGTEPIKILKGNVHIKHQETHLWADSITIFDKDSAIAIGNVRFSVGDTILGSGANRLTYNKKLIIATGNITVASKQNTITTSFFNYDLQTQTATATNISWTTPSTHILAKHLIIKDKTFIFIDSVKAHRNNTYSTSDTLIFNQRTNKYTFSGNVLIVHDNDSIFARRLIAFQDKQEIYVGFGIHSDSLLWIADTVLIDTNIQILKTALIKRDSLLLASKKVIFYNNQLLLKDTFSLLICHNNGDSTLLLGKQLYLDSSQQNGFIYKGVIKQDQSYMWANSILMFDSIVLLRPNGWISLNNWFITGDEIIIYKPDSLVNKQFDSIVISGNAWMIKPLDSIHTNQLQTPKMIIRSFKNDSITTIACCPVKTVFYNTNDKGAISSVNYTEGNILFAIFTNDSLRKVTLYENLSGHIKENATINLKGLPTVNLPSVTTPIKFWVETLNPLSKHLIDNLTKRFHCREVLNPGQSTNPY